MIDLDALEASEDSFELYCHFGLLLVSGRITYRDWSFCTNGLGIKKYVLPDQRALVEVLLDEMYNRHKKSTTTMMWHCMTMGHIEAHYTETHQIRILHLLMATPRHKVRSST